METALLTAGLLVMGYLIGSLPMGVIVARLTGATDPRTVGSGRTGGTNALRAMGWWRALTVGLLDLAKGAVAILIARSLDVPVEIQALTGVAAVLGSWKSVFVGFGGGRGVATGVGGMLAISPVIFVIAAPVFFTIIGVTRYVSLGSLLGTAFGGGLVIIFAMLGWIDAAWLIYVVPAISIVWIAHRDNIRRLLEGTERRFEPGNRRSTSTSESSLDEPPPADARDPDGDQAGPKP
ncbi:MAG: glycerol-3-phosphate 1-O-acyltransferase PlsY [Chloroflexota bacterium]